MPATPLHPAPPLGRRAGRWADLRADVGASLVVFLVAVPLSLGIALASGAPVLAGLVAAVVGGVVAGLLGGSPLQVTGPAAGMTIVVAELIVRFGWPTTCLITAGAGLLQIAFGCARVARFAQAVPPAVVHGMLAGIGLTIALAQVHVVLGAAPPAGALAALAGLPATVAAAVPPAVAVGLLVVAVLVAWPRLPAPVRVVPGPLVGVAAGTLLAVAWPGAPLVDLPGGLLSAITLPTLLPAADWAGIAGGVLTVALVASVESLLSAVAVDRMQTAAPRTDADRELLGQGAANTASGLLGGLPVTGVIVRSAANVRAGARTRAATVLHGVWIAVFAAGLVGVVELVPLAALAALLVVVGLQLVRPADVRSARAHGDLPVYLATVAGVLALNLLEGVAVGLAVAGVLALRRALRVRHVEVDGRHRVVVEGALSFLAVPALARVLSAVPAGADVHVDLLADRLDNAGHDHLHGWAARQRASGGAVAVAEPAPRLIVAGPPAGLVVACVDAPVLPGAVVTVSNVGGLVAGTAVQAAVQYAAALAPVAVCGHSGCAAMRLLLDGGGSGPLADWLAAARPSLEAFRAGHPVGAAALAAGYAETDALGMVTVARQLDVLAADVPTEPAGLFVDADARLLVLDRVAQRFVPAGHGPAANAVAGRLASA